MVESSSSLEVVSDQIDHSVTASYDLIQNTRNIVEQSQTHHKDSGQLGDKQTLDRHISSNRYKQTLSAVKQELGTSSQRHT